MERGAANRADYQSKHQPPIHHQQQQAQCVINAAVAEETKYVITNICNKMHCMHAVVLNQVNVQWCVEALPGLTKHDTQVGANMTAQKTNRQQKRPKPGSVPIAHM
eukprot:13097550-Ditylum_brightwellii.AAC.1